MTTALLGTGRMGRELGRHLLEAGHELVVWNRHPDAAEPLVDAGARLADDAQSAVADAELVVTVLFGPDALRDVMSPLSLASGALWVDVSTVSPDDTDEWAGWADQHGVRYVHAPVIGSLAPARQGTLRVLMGGSASDVRQARAVVELWGDPERIEELSSPREAAAGKLLANLALGTATQALTEALAFGRANGLDTERVFELLNGTALAGVIAAKGEVIRSQAYADTQFSADLLAKDARLMIRSCPTALPTVTALLAGLEAAGRAGRGGEDFTTIARP